MRLPRFASALPVSSIALPPGAALLPPECACCGEPATHQVALERAGSASLFVGYCDACAEHQAAASARSLALALASALLGLASAAGLPLLFPRLGLAGLSCLTLVLSVLPLALLLVPRAVAEPPHTARGPVLSARAEQLLSSNAAYAERLAALNGAVPQATTHRERFGSPWLSAGPVIALGAACLAYFVYHPLLRVLNLGTSRILLVLDGAPFASVDPTSNESPSAGALVRVPAGHHLITVNRADGTRVAELSADFQSGAVHLYAPASEGTCFWLETTGYGLEQRVAPSYEPLVSNDLFWVLPGGIDNWFAPNPRPTPGGSQSSGGLLTALRQAPCSEAPPEARATP